MSKASIKASMKRLLRRLGWEVQRFENATVEQQVLKNILRATGVDVILDVGANTGQYGDLVFESGFDGALISFEAIPSVHEQLSRHAIAKRAQWKVAPCAALGSSRGQIDINISANSVSSSILPMRETHLDAAPDSRYVDKLTVSVDRLDALAPEFVPASAVVLLKVDTQGYEMEVLKGATGLLQRVVAIQLELSLTPLYEGAPTFVEMIDFMASAGFDLFSIVPGLRDQRSGRLLQVDGFFVRSELSRGRYPDSRIAAEPLT
jgi:FkbM family methyltransferase